jgi:hypothetical protein
MPAEPRGAVSGHGDHTDVARRFREAADAGDPWAAAVAAAVERDDARQQLKGAVEALRESAETLHRVSPWWEHAERSFEDCPAEACVKARAALGEGEGS